MAAELGRDAVRLITKTTTGSHWDNIVLPSSKTAPPLPFAPSMSRGGFAQRGRQGRVQLLIGVQLPADLAIHRRPAPDQQRLLRGQQQAVCRRRLRPRERGAALPPRPAAPA